MTTKAEQTPFSPGNQNLIKILVGWIESGKMPDFIVRFGIRRLIKQRLKEEFATNPEINSHRYDVFLQELKQSILAIETDKANDQHYEVDTLFYEYALTTTQCSKVPITDRFALMENLSTKK